MGWPHIDGIDTHKVSGYLLIPRVEHRRSKVTTLLRCRVVGTVGAFAVLSSDGEGKFDEGVRDPMPRIDVGGQFVMTAVEILDKVVSRAKYSR